MGPLEVKEPNSAPWVVNSPCNVDKSKNIPEIKYLEERVSGTEIQLSHHSESGLVLAPHVAWSGNSSVFRNCSTVKVFGSEGLTMV